jgi:hypothetical protein
MGMAMTIAVYRVNPKTGVRTDVQSKRTFVPGDVPEWAGGFPPCTCPRCVAAIRQRRES